MTMHLVGPYLTTTNYRTKKAQPSKAKQAQWQADWQEQNRLLKRQGRPRITYEQYLNEIHGRPNKPLLTTASKPRLEVPESRSTQSIPSCDTWSGDTAKKPSQQYTGNNILGISQMAKSNAVPVFSKQEIIDIGKMRRG